MTATPFEKLTAMWQSGEINDDEYKLATRYLREELRQGGNTTAASVGSTGSRQFRRKMVELAFGRERVAGWAPWKQRLADQAAFAAFWCVTILGTVQIGTAMLISSIDAPTVVSRSSPSAGIVGQSQAKSAPDPLRHLFLDEPVYRKLVQAADYGAEWPFPRYSEGTIRCERRTVSRVTRPLVTIEFGGKVYGLNGAAQGWAGYPDSRPLTARHPEWGTYELGASGTMIADALANCS